jgi:hypothetical protein
MVEFIELLIDSHLIWLNAFIVISLLVVWHIWRSQTPNRTPTKVKVLRIGGLCCFAFFAIWLMQQQHHVLNGELFPTSDSPVAVSLRGVTRYVSQRQALLYEYGMLPMVVLILCYAAVERLLQRGSSEA